MWGCLHHSRIDFYCASLIQPCRKFYSGIACWFRSRLSSIESRFTGLANQLWWSGERNGSASHGFRPDTDHYCNIVRSMWPRFHTQDSCKLLIQREQSIRNSEVSIGQLVTVIIPALHRPDLTRRCIESLQSQTLASGSMGLVVVENDARAETVLPEPLPENVRRMDLAENLGTTGSVNRALAETRSKYVLLLNNDVELEPRFLQILLSAMEQDARCGFATGKILDATDRTRIDGAGDALLLAGGAFRLGHGDPDLGQFDSPCDVLAGCGAATLFRRSALSQAGGLDEDFFAYLDDVDLCLRLQLLGYRGVYIPAAVA